MAQYEEAVSIAFNVNDGGLTHKINPIMAEDIKRHYRIYGKWKARFMFFKSFWIGLKRLEKHIK